MQKNLFIRKYVSNDKAHIIALLRLNTPEYFSPSEEPDLFHYLENESQNYFVIEFDGKIVGCGGFNFSDDLTVGIISWDIFHPDHQGKGFGSMLTNFRIEKIKEFESVKTIRVRTSQLAFKFYEKFGFKLKEIVKDYWAEGFDMYRMEFPVNEG